MKAKRHFDSRKLDHKTLEQIRIQAIRRVEAGESPEDVIAEIGMNPRNIYRWIARYHAGGIDGLRAGKLSGRPPKLGAKEIRWLYQTITGKNPLQLGFGMALWSRPIVAELIFRRFKVRLHVTNVGRLLRRMGLTPQKPLRRAMERNPELIEAWKRNEFPKIKAQAKREKAIIFFQDESGVRSDFQSGTSWSPKGKTPVIQKTGKRFSLNMISAISSRGDMCFMTTRKSVNASVFLDFLKRLLHGQRQKIYLIVDGHPSHRAKLVKNFLATVHDRLRLIFLPPYAPEINPSELVWNSVKGKIGRAGIKTPKELKSRVVGELRRLQKNPEKVRRLFQEENVRYAA